jgi:hypothetical protein
VTIERIFPVHDLKSAHATATAKAAEPQITPVDGWYGSPSFLVRSPLPMISEPRQSKVDISKRIAEMVAEAIVPIKPRAGFFAMVNKLPIGMEFVALTDPDDALMVVQGAFFTFAAYRAKAHKFLAAPGLKFAVGFDDAGSPVAVIAGYRFDLDDADVALTLAQESWSWEAGAARKATKKDPPANATRAGLIAAYERRLLDQYEWAKDDARRERFVAGVRQSLATGRKGFATTGRAWLAALDDCGLPRRPSFKSLCALPEGETP